MELGMADHNWLKEYVELLLETYDNGNIPPLDPNNQLRNNPRYSVPKGVVSVKIEPQFELVDVSVGGLAFISNMPFSPGNEVQIALANAAVHLQIINCVMEPFELDTPDIHYRINGRFLRQQVGMEILGIYKELNQLDIQRAHW